MPLVRYEVRNEYGLANPELYRAAALDDPKGLLEGVTVAGLVGIVRQLGDLAELAAGVFHELHEEVMATAARGHDLLVRVQQLEAELPVVEKYLFMDANQLQFASASGAEWHARIRTDQNHLTQGDLPRFIRTLYEECRGPPKLFLLDKFDGVGDGACLKRYTDPSFFKMEWASSELMKAEKEQRDKQAQRIKKGRRRRSGEINGAFNVSQMFSRARYSSLDVENMIGKSGTYINKLKLEPQSGRPSNTFSPNKHVMDNDLQASSSKATLEYEDNIQPNMDRQNGDIGASVVAEPLKVNAQGTETEDWSAKYVEEDNIAGLKESSVNLARKAVAGAVVEDDSDIEQFVDALTTMDSEVETDPESKAKDSDFFSKVKEEISKHNEVPDEQRFDAEKDLVSILPTAESNEPIKKTDPVLFPTSPVKTESPSFLDEDDDLPSLDEDDASSILNKKSPFILEHNIETLGLDHVSKSSPIPELKSPDDTQLDDSLSSFYLLPDPVIQLANADGDGYLNGLGSLSSHRQTKSFEMPTEGNTRFTEEKPSFDEPESVPSRTPEEFSPGSSAESISIQPMWFTMAHTSIHDTSEDNEDIDYMQASSSSSSFSSSTISSPRPSLLATTEFHVVSKAEPKLPLSSQISASSSPIFSAPHSPVSLVNIAPLTSTSSEPQMQSLHSELLVPSSPMLSSEFTIAELEDLPPPPPLPPLEWRMMKSQHRPLESALKLTKPSPPPPAPPIPPVRFENGSQDQFPSVVLQKFQRRGSLIEAIAIHDKSMLRKVKEQRFSPIRKPVGEREVLLEQIRTRSFSLRHTVVEKHETPRAVTNINVAAILEKANAIRQAFAGSDEDEDDWSNS